MSLSVVTPPAGTAISLDHMKSHLRIEHSEDDATLQALIASAITHVEKAARSLLETRVLRQYADLLPASGCLMLETWPVESIEAVTVYDGDGNATLLEDSAYRLDKSHAPAALIFSAPPQGVVAFEVDLRAGYGATLEELPADLVQAVRLLASHWYEFRGATTPDMADSFIPKGLETLIRSKRGRKL